MSYRKRLERLTSRTAAAAAALSISLGVAGTAQADLATQWNLIGIDNIKAAGGAIANANRAPRVLAILHLAVYDVVANIDKTHAPYLSEIEPPEGVNERAAVLGAAHWVLSVYLPARRPVLNGLLADALGDLPTTAEIDASVDYGVEIAQALIDARATDGSAATTGYPGSTDLGKWRPVDATPAEAAVEPYWNVVTPFALAGPEQFRPAAPPALDSAAYATAVDQVRLLGGAATTATTTITRNSTQTEIANFWIQATHVPLFAIARQVVNARDLTLNEEVRLFAELAVALADSRIAAWDAKYFYGVADAGDHHDGGGDDDDGCSVANAGSSSNAGGFTLSALALATLWLTRRRRSTVTL